MFCGNLCPSADDLAFGIPLPWWSLGSLAATKKAPDEVQQPAISSGIGHWSWRRGGSQPSTIDARVQQALIEKWRDYLSENLEIRERPVD